MRREGYLQSHSGDFLGTVSLFPPFLLLYAMVIVVKLCVLACCVGVLLLNWYAAARLKWLIEDYTKSFSVWRMWSYVWVLVLLWCRIAWWLCSGEGLVREGRMKDEVFDQRLKDKVFRKKGAVVSSFFVKNDLPIIWTLLYLFFPLYSCIILGFVGYVFLVLFMLYWTCLCNLNVGSNIVHA